MLTSLPFFATFLVLGFNAVVLNCLRVSTNASLGLSAELQMQESESLNMGTDRCCCKPKSKSGRADLTQAGCSASKYWWVTIPSKGEHCCKIYKSMIGCPGYGKDAYGQVEMGICQTAQFDLLSCDQKSQHLGVAATCARPECNLWCNSLTCDQKGQELGVAATCARPECSDQWCKAECQKVDLGTACARPECANLKLALGAAPRQRFVPFLNCKSGFKPCCGSQDYFGGKASYSSKQACKQQFSTAKCLKLGHELGQGDLDLKCVPIGETCPAKIVAPRRTSSHCPQVGSRGPFRLCCGNKDVFERLNGGKGHLFGEYKSCQYSARSTGCLGEFGVDTQPCCVPASQECVGYL